MSNTSTETTHTPCAQRRPGREPRRHSPPRVRARSAAWPAQRRPGREPRRHRRRDARRPARCSALNEGRGANPGDTPFPAVADCTRKSLAQRRPGREPRRHPGSCSVTIHTTLAQRRPGREPRRHSARQMTAPSGVDAQRRPGREPRRHIPTGARRSSSTDAQRRPGREPRRHAPGDDRGPGDGRRSTKAGARTPATLVSMADGGWAVRPLNEGRGANPGDTCGRGPSAAHRHPLNEGRGANPGDTRCQR